jgi:phage/plasmid-associated DNA primase
MTLGFHRGAPYQRRGGGCGYERLDEDRVRVTIQSTCVCEACGYYARTRGMLYAQAAEEKDGKKKAALEDQTEKLRIPKVTTRLVDEVYSAMTRDEDRLITVEFDQHIDDAPLPDWATGVEFIDKFRSENRPRPARHWVACKNGILDLDTGKLLPPDPGWFSPACLSIDYAEDAPRRRSGQPTSTR